MTNRLLPFYKTGWFYLLLTLWLVSYWGTNNGSYNLLNQLNIKALPAHSISDNDHSIGVSSVVRIKADLNNAQYNNIEKLLKKTPHVAMLFIGLPSPTFSQKFSSFLRTHQRGSDIMVTTELFGSRVAVNSEESTFFAPVLSWFRSVPLHKGQRLNANGLVYVPLLANKSNEMPLLWRTKDNQYFTVLGETIRQVENSKSLTLHQGWQLALSNERYTRLFGFNGYIVSGASSPEPIAIEKWSDHVSSDTQLIIIDADNGEYGEQVSKMVTAVLDNQYLYQTLAVKFVEVLLFVVGLYLLWLCHVYIGKHLVKILSIYVLLMFVLQFYLALNNLWLEVVPCALVLYLSLAIWIAYQREIQTMMGWNKRYNTLLANSLVGIASPQNMAELQPLLSKTLPDKNLVESLYQFGLKAEQNHNSDTAQQIYRWIESCGIAHNGTQNKLIALRQKTNNPAINRAHGQHSLANSRSTQNNQLKAPSEREDNATAEQQKISSAPRSIYQSPVTQAKTGLAYEATMIHKSPKVSTMPLEHTIKTSADTLDELEQTVIISPGQKPPNLAATGSFTVEKFGRYQVEGILGKGAMGIVYQGVDPRINRHVAIKTMQLHEGVDQDEMDEAKARFFKEAETAGNLSHANIVTIYDVGEQDSLGYIAMDLLTGAPLSHFIKQGNLLPPALVYQLMIQITDALEYAHNLNIVHRDIKPGNIIYDDDLQRVTVTDFGIAFVGDSSKTRTGVIMGSPYYMSPEQVLGKQVDGRSDVFSLGSTFYQLLSGCLPFEGDSVVSVVYQITKEKHKPVNTCIDGLTASAARITNKALHKDIDKRYQSMQEFKLALIAALKRDYKKAPFI